MSVIDELFSSLGTGQNNKLILTSLADAFADIGDEARQGWIFEFVECFLNDIHFVDAADLLQYLKICEIRDENSSVHSLLA